HLSTLPYVEHYFRFPHHRSAHTQDPHSFPTRRSSDLRQTVRSKAECHLSYERFLAQNRSKHQQRCRDKDRAKIARRLTAKRNLSDRKSTRLNSSHVSISYAVFCLKKKI